MKNCGVANHFTVSSEAKAAYTVIIDDILAGADLTLISAKAIRKGLQAKVSEELSPLKVRLFVFLSSLLQTDIVFQGPLNELIIERFDKANAALTVAATTESTKSEPEVNGIKSNGTSARSGATSSSSPQKRPATEEPQEESDLSEPADDSPPPKKKNKKQRASVDEDAAFAARLQAEENNRARPTRGGSQKKRVVAKSKKDKKSPKKKSSAKVKDDDDSELDSGSGGEKKEKKRNGAFHVSQLHAPPCPPHDRWWVEKLTRCAVETDEPIHSARLTRRRTCTLASADGQEDLGIRQRARPARPERQAPNPL